MYEVYLVGGAVRDRLLQVEEKDHDFVVVGATAEDLLAQNLRQVGKDFPTFVDNDGRQYSLARRSRTGGVADFGPEVTLAEDLFKRDLTINAMAIGVGNTLYDPHGGRSDLNRKVLRMVHPSSFVEDPIRVLRVARFAARYPDFTVDPETMFIMKAMVADKKLDNLVPERVWKEVSRGLMEGKPSRMLQVLRECGALKVVMPEIDALYGVPQPPQHHPEIDTGIHIEQVVDYAASMNFELPVRFAALVHDTGKARTPPEDWPAHHGHEGFGVGPTQTLCRRLMVPNEIEQVAVRMTREHGNIHKAMGLKVTSIVKILRKCDAFRNPERFQYVLQAALCDARGRHSDTISFANVEYPQAMRFSNALWAAKQIDAGEVAAQYGKDNRYQLIPAAIHAARARAIKRFEKQYSINN